MYSSLPPQEGFDPKLSSIMAAQSSADTHPPSFGVPNTVANDAATMKQPPQVGMDPKLLVCMNDGDGTNKNDDLAKESVANSLLSFKLTLPASVSSSSTATKTPQNSSNVAAKAFPMKPNSKSQDSSVNVASTSVKAAAAEPYINNSNFWLQEEEERFLLGLRMFGWGQWKRIQQIVKTRTNKQIKSHAQKRERVNPEIKIKYAKFKSRRGRISSGVLANDAIVLSSNGGDLLNAFARDDQHLPPLAQMVKDVYLTNNADAPRRRKLAAPYSKVVVKDVYLTNNADAPRRRKLAAPYSKVVQVQHLTLMQESTTPLTTITTSVEQSQTRYDPGMEVYIRLSNGKWTPGVIHSVIPSGPTYNICQGNVVSPCVPANLIMSKNCYDEIIEKLETHFALPTDTNLTRPHPLPSGTPVHAQFMNRLDPDSHARWLTGTVNSCVKKLVGPEKVYTYHILFDNNEEAYGLEEKNVLHRLDYKLKVI